MDQKADQITAVCRQLLYHKQDLPVTDQNSAPQQPSSDFKSSQSKWMASSSGTTDPIISEDGLSNGTFEAEAIVALQCPGDGGDVTAGGDHPALSNDGMSEFSNSDLSLPEVCISTNSNSLEDDMNYEVQQAYRIFTGFLLDKHKGITSPLLLPIGHHDAQHGVEGVQGRVQSQLRQSMCLQRIEEKFINKEYETITEFVADFRLMLENCYRYHGVDHWISKQAQKMEIMLEQKLTLLSRTLREKTTLAVTSKGRFGAEEDRGSGGTSTRRRLAPRSLTTITVGGHESIMVQTLRLEEQQRAKEEKRQRELEKKEAEEMSAKEVEEWEQNLLSQASPQTVDALWELPAIGHFLCLAQTALNLPEIIFFELERCLLMPRCSLLLSKIMSSLLSPYQRRTTLHRRPALPYRRWESELRQRVTGWYRAVGSSHDQPRRAEQLGLCHQFFSVLGEVNPLVEKPFHLLHFHQRVWLLKGLCDHVYETQKDVQDAVLAQPIHECRESILGYDSKENAYIHFPHFCGADLRIYCQSPSTPPAFPFPSVLVKKVETEQGSEGEESDGIKEEDKNYRTCDGTPMDTRESGDFVKRTINTLGIFKEENENGEEDTKRFNSWSLIKEEMSDSASSDEDHKLDLHSLSITCKSPICESDVNYKEEIVEQQSKQEQAFSLVSERTIKAETQDPCLNVGEHSYTGRSPARLVTFSPQTKPLGLKMEEASQSQGDQTSPCLECRKGKISHAKSAEHVCCCATSGLPTQVSSESSQNSSEEKVNDKIWTKKKKRKKRQTREQLLRVKKERKHLQYADRMRLFPAEAAKSTACKVATTIKRKDKNKKQKPGKKQESLGKTKDEDESPLEPSFKLVCTNLDELRELISKTEDELDDLESTKKRLGRWYYRREAVKDLHSTLIRLLNELSPWEPKLIKAHQRNRLRLKKEFDDFKKQPEYNNFQREECVSSSSDDAYDDEEKDFETDRCGGSEEDDLEHIVPRGLWSGASTRECGAESAGEKTVSCISPNHPKQYVAGSEKGTSLLPRVQGVGGIITSPDLKGELRSESVIANQPKDLEWAARVSAHTLVPPSSIMTPTSGLPKGYTPIPTLLAKSVGNKVTLMKRPTDFPSESSGDGQIKGSLVSLPTSALTYLKMSKAQSSPSSSQQNLQQLVTQRPQQTQVLVQQGIAKAALAKMPQATPTQIEPKSPVQVKCKVPDGLGHLVRKDNSSPVNISVHSVVDKNPAEKVMQQVVILPPNLLTQRTEENLPSSNQQSKGIQVAVSKVTSPVCVSTNVPGFSIPENKIPVQQVAPLKDARTRRTLPFSVSPSQQQETLKTARFKGAQIGNVQVSTTQGGIPPPSSITYLSSAVSSDTVKSPDPKQELKTVCIRDSQSILVTTRGGNKGIVKVQPSSDQNALGAFPTSPVITISPQFKAFLVSKTSTTLSASVPSQTSSTVPAVTSMYQPQKQCPWVSKAPFTVTNSMLTTVRSNIPVPGPGSQTTVSTVASSQSSSIPTCSTVEANISLNVEKAVAGSHVPTLKLNNTFGVPSVSGSDVSQVLKKEIISKTGVKRASTDEQTQVSKYILVTPSSPSTSNVTTSKGTSTTKVAPSSRIMFIGQPTATSTTNFTGSVPNQVMASGNSGQALTTSISSHSLRMGLSPVQRFPSVSSEALPKGKTTWPSGVQIQSSGKTTTIGQNIGVLSHSLSKASSMPVSGTCCPTAAATTGMVPISNLTTVTSSLPFGTLSSLTTHSPLVGIPSISVISQTSCATSPSAPATVFAGNMDNKEFGTPGTTLSKSCPVQVTTAIRSGTAQNPTSCLDSKPSYLKSGIQEDSDSLLSSSQLTCNESQTSFSSAPTTSTTGAVQQRIIINTSTPLAAGTQILLNNARFVVPPQGLGPGSHVLIISNPASQVPSASPTSSGASVSPRGANHASVTSRAPVLPQTAVRRPGVSAVGSPLVVCNPAIGSPLLGTTQHPTPLRFTGAPVLGSAVIPSNTNVVSALPRLPSAHAGSFALPPVATSGLGSSPPLLGGVPALVSPVITGAPLLSSALSTNRVAASTAIQAECSSAKSSTVAASLPTLCRPISSLPIIPSTSAGALHSPVIPVPASVSSGAASLVSDTPTLRCSLPAQQVVAMTFASSVQPQQMTVRVAAPSSVHPKGLVHTGPGHLPVKKQVPVMQPVLAGAQTHVLPTVAVPPIVSTLSRTQTLPIATVQPIGSTVSTFETAPVMSPSLSGTPVITTPAQPITSPTSKNNIHPPVILTNQTLGQHSAQTSTIGMHTNVTSKLLISPDGAVLSTAQCHVNPAALTAGPRPVDALAISSNSFTGALVTHDSTIQPPQANTK